MAKKNKKDIQPPPNANAAPEELAAYFEKHSLEDLEKAGYVSDLDASEQADMNELAEFSRSRSAARKARAQLNLAFSSDQLDRFIEYANRKHIPPSTLAKAWILERLDEEAKDA